MSRQFYVYLLSNFTNSVMYTGVTNDLLRRVQEHREGKANSFTTRYKVWKLVYFESGEDIRSTIEREKQIKAGSRRRKVALVESINPTCRDLYRDFTEESSEQKIASLAPTSSQ
jgi:putative endonuclease